MERYLKKLDPMNKRIDRFLDNNWNMFLSVMAIVCVGLMILASKRYVG